MGVYIAPEIKDRVAVGDDLYTITDSGGKKKLTPSPTEVSEPGTEINKELLQPMADALARIDAAAVPYVLYWWRRRAVANGYSDGMWETISADTSDAYPHSGESGGYEWVYCGRISDFTPSLYPLGIKTINLTSASWNNGSYTLQLPCTRYLLWCYRDDTYSPSGVVLMVDNGLAYGEYLKITSNGDYLRYVAGNSSITNVNGVTFAFTSTGITLTGSGTLTLAYLPL